MRKEQDLPRRPKKNTLLPFLKPSTVFFYLWFWVIERWIFLSLSQEARVPCVFHTAAAFHTKKVFFTWFFLWHLKNPHWTLPHSFFPSQRHQCELAGGKTLTSLKPGERSADMSGITRWLRIPVRLGTLVISLKAGHLNSRRYLLILEVS